LPPFYLFDTIFHADVYDFYQNMSSFGEMPHANVINHSSYNNAPNTGHFAAIGLPLKQTYEAHHHPSRPYPFLAQAHAWSCYCNSGSSATVLCGSGWGLPIEVAYSPPPLHYYGRTKVQTTSFKTYCVGRGTTATCY
jgi:hypothetical protein